ncbi:MAG: D-glycerate dehydrogenase [Thaumarchaeota archaeon]|nr:D-glycerate dehydrogenase [Nitrososphaerota archaeon]MCL5319118.1 D-glycerate dehydrogenase [Nitrososphaerota archaeon]
MPNLNSRPKIYVTRQIPPPGLDILAEHCDVTVHSDEKPPSRDEILRQIRGKDGLLCMLTDRVDAAIIDAASKLRVVSSFSVGVDHIDVPEATRRGVYITYTPGVLTDATADLAFALLMAAARRIAEADQYVRSGRWKAGWSPTILLGEGVYGKTLGVVGLGRIGEAVAKRALGFRMRVLYYSRRRSPEKEMELGVEYCPLDALLKESDFVSLHIPLTEETRRLIDRERLKSMKRNAILINTARGPVVDEDALAEALEKRWIAGAGLDVFSAEPLPAGSPFLKLRNVVLAPHIGSATNETRRRMSEISARNLLAVLKGEEPPHLFNPDVKKIRPLSKTKML